MAVALGTAGYVSALRRTAVGKYGADRAISLEHLRELGHKGCLHEVLQPLESALDDILAIEADSALSAKLRNGQAAFLPSQSAEEIMAYATHQNKVVAIGNLKDRVFRPVRVFNY